MIQVFMCILVLGLCSVSEGCGRVPATPPPTTPPAPTAPTVNGSVQGLVCTSQEHNDTACLNGGTCFVFLLEEERVTTCHCPEMYIGKRCQELDFGEWPSTPREPDHIARAGIAASVVVLVIIVVVFTATFIVYRRRKRREEEEKKKPAAGVNGSLLPENPHPPNPNMQYAKNGGSNHMNFGGGSNHMNFGGGSNHMNFEEKKPLHHYQITSV